MVRLARTRGAHFRFGNDGRLVGKTMIDEAILDNARFDLGLAPRTRYEELCI